MLHLTERIKLNRRFKKYLKSLKPYNGQSWENNRTIRFTNITSLIKQQLLLNQKFRCAYCEIRLAGVDKEVDHIAPRGDAFYPEFTFNNLNLVYSCGYCNSPGKKGQRNVVALYNTQYNLCRFDMIHPYLDPQNAGDIQYIDNDKIYLDLTNCSVKGLFTINLFNWDSNEGILLRSRVKWERDNPLANLDILNLISETVKYKKYKRPR